MISFPVSGEVVPVFSSSHSQIRRKFFELPNRLLFANPPSLTNFLIILLYILLWNNGKG